MIRIGFVDALILRINCRGIAGTVTFDALTAGTQYPSGSQFSDSGLDFDVITGLYFTTAANFRVMAVGSTVYNPAFSGDFQNLPSNVGLAVNLPSGASQMRLDFYRGHTNCELWINGNRLSLSNIPSTSIPGVTVTNIHGVKPPANPWGSITTTGNIYSFAIIGTELLVDNLTATLSPGPAGDYNNDNAVDAADLSMCAK